MRAAPVRAVIVGGGVAGSACAIALARVGARVTVYEAHEDPAGPVGSFVSLAVNGLRALDALGALGAVQDAGFPVERHRMWSGRGRSLGDVARGRRSGDPLLSVTVRRADLVRALRAAAVQAGASIVTGRRVTPEAGGPEDATAPADLVVGADGLWSAVRRALLPGGPEPAYAGLYSVSGMAPADAVHGPGGGALPSGFNWVFCRSGIFIYLPAPDGSVWWSAQVAAPQPPPDLSAVTVGELRARFPEPPAAAVLAAAGTVGTTTRLHVLTPVPRRQDGRTVLVGDAAHPVGAGQGASIALEDAVVLARAVAAAGPAGVRVALAAFDAERQARTRKLARTAAANRDVKTAGPVAARLREIMMPVIFPRVFERATGWLYDYDPGDLPVPAASISSMDV
jgi:2-polyprenyl-6-methoxyphenol hydroxylase-like FAD-dependent oxidoreductase